MANWEILAAPRWTPVRRRSSGDRSCLGFLTCALYTGVFYSFLEGKSCPCCSLARRALGWPSCIGSSSVQICLASPLSYRSFLVKTTVSRSSPDKVGAAPPQSSSEETESTVITSLLQRLHIRTSGSRKSSPSRAPRFSTPPSLSSHGSRSSSKSRTTASNHAASIGAGTTMPPSSVLSTPPPGAVKRPRLRDEHDAREDAGSAGQTTLHADRQGSASQAPGTAVQVPFYLNKTRDGKRSPGPGGHVRRPNVSRQRYHRPFRT